ncbi:MAG: glutamate--tRNA ligase family protein [Acidobacteriota bacterium]
MEVGRFAPTTSGPAHPGTLLAALLAWLDARHRGARFLLRLEDLDPERTTPQRGREMIEQLTWFGLDWDDLIWQSTAAARHRQALDTLAADGHLYFCTCSRRQIREHGRTIPGGGYRYPGTCRERPLPIDWRERTHDAVIRLRLEPGVETIPDESGLDLSLDPWHVHGDPIVRRRDGAVAYNLAVVVDDAAADVTRVVRGRDLASSTATQHRIATLLGLPEPTYRHHFLLLEDHRGKLSKSGKSVGVPELRERYRPVELCGVLACYAGLLERPDAIEPRRLLDGFQWSRVRTDDLEIVWDGESLQRVAS